MQPDRIPGDPTGTNFRVVVASSVDGIDRGAIGQRQGRPVRLKPLGSATLDARAWVDSGLVDRGFSVHVNVAGRQLAEGTFVERVLGLDCFMKLARIEDRMMRTPPVKHREVLEEMGVSLMSDTYGTSVPRRGLMRI